MAITSKLTLRYQRRQGFPGYSHVELETIKEFLIEQNDDPNQVEDAAWLAMAASIAARIEPIAASYRQQAPERSPQTTPEGKKPPQRSPQATKTEAGQGELVLAKMPAKRQAGRELPKYDAKGLRKRTVDQKGFTAAEITSAWQALADLGAVQGEITSGRGHNEERNQSRSWLMMSPLDPGFSQTELQFVAERYVDWRNQGNTAAESMKEVGNDFKFTFADAPAKSADSGDTGGGDKPPEQGEGGDGPGDQEPQGSAGDAEDDDGGPGDGEPEESEGDGDGDGDF